jgi:hypothetical protein
MSLRHTVTSNEVPSNIKSEEMWDDWLKANLSSGEYGLHVTGLQTIHKTHEDGVVELIKKQGEDMVSMGYYRLKLEDR